MTSQAGRVVISNHTEFDWKRTYCVSYQLSHWNFPELIPKNTSIDCWVQWSKSPFRKAQSRAGCVYQFVGTNRGSFFLGASSEDGLNLYVEYEQLFNLGTRRIDLGWYRNGIMPFFIAGTSNNYVSTETLNLSPPSSRESSRRSSQELPPDVPPGTPSSRELSDVLRDELRAKPHACLSEPTKWPAKHLNKSSDKNATESKDEEKNESENDFEFETFSAIFAVLILIFIISVFVLINQQHRLI